MVLAFGKPYQVRYLDVLEVLSGIYPNTKEMMQQNESHDIYRPTGIPFPMKINK